MLNKAKLLHNKNGWEKKVEVIIENDLWKLKYKSESAAHSEKEN